MDTISITQASWIAFICATWLVVMEITYIMLTDDEVKQAAQVILNYSDTSRQFELFIKTINASAPSVDTGSPQWLEQASVALGMTKRELLWRLSKQRDERKVS